VLQRCGLYVGAIERGEHSVSIDNIAWIAKALGDLIGEQVSD
jgi:transcriptional regulator with XRE-family HTH domain